MAADGLELGAAALGDMRALRDTDVDPGAGAAVPRVRRARGRMNAVAEFRWADEQGVLGLPHPEELEYLGYQRVRRHPRWPTSWLMRRDLT